MRLGIQLVLNGIPEEIRVRFDTDLESSGPRFDRRRGAPWYLVAKLCFWIDKIWTFAEMTHWVCFTERIHFWNRNDRRHSYFFTNIIFHLILIHLNRIPSFPHRHLKKPQNYCQGSLSSHFGITSLLLLDYSYLINSVDLFFRISFFPLPPRDGWELY